MRSRSVLYRFNEKGEPVKEPAFSIFNPFRDRGPENSGDIFLKLLKDGKCEEVIASLSVKTENRQELCGREANSPLVAWKLIELTRLMQQECTIEHSGEAMMATRGNFG